MKLNKIPKGKCFSMVDQGQRRKADMYPTHYGLTRLFLDKEPLSPFDIIYEPACGEDNAIGIIVHKLMPDAMLICSDKYSGGTLFTAGKAYSLVPSDFIEDIPFACDIILCNPPYSLFKEFIKKAKAIATKKIAFLLPLSYLQGQQRYDELWQDTEFPLARIYVFNRFPDMTAPLREDGKFPTSMLAMAWYVWEKGYEGAPTIQWLDCRQYVLKKGDM